MQPNQNPNLQPQPGNPNQQPLPPTPEQQPAPAAPEVAPPPPAPAPPPPATAPVAPAAPLAPGDPAAQSAPPAKPPVAGPNPSVAGDVDVIEKEWVDQADKIIKRTAGDPYIEEEAVESLQQDYLKKRYGHEVKKPEDK